MTTFQMRLAVAEIYEGKSFNESVLPKTHKNKITWNELYEEIKFGFSIDMQGVRVSFQSKS